MPTAGSPRVIYRLPPDEYSEAARTAEAAGLSVNEYARALMLLANETTRTQPDPSGPVVRVTPARTSPRGITPPGLRRASDRLSGPNPTQPPIHPTHR